MMDDQIITFHMASRAMSSSTSLSGDPCESCRDSQLRLTFYNNKINMQGRYLAFWGFAIQNSLEYIFALYNSQ